MWSTPKTYAFNGKTDKCTKNNIKTAKITSNIDFERVCCLNASNGREQTTFEGKQISDLLPLVALGDIMAGHFWPDSTKR